MSACRVRKGRPTVPAARLVIGPPVAEPARAAWLAPRVSRQALWSYLRAHRLFGVLPEEALAGPVASVIEREYPRGQRLFYPGDPPSFVFVIRAGLVALTELDSSGTVHGLLAFGAGDVLGLGSVVASRQRTSLATALLDTMALLVPVQDFDCLLDNHPCFARQVTREMSEVLRQSEEAIFRRTLTPVPVRLAMLLLEVAAKSPTGERMGGKLSVPLSHRELALLLGTSRETVTRAVGRLMRAGIVGARTNEIVILQPGRLRELAGL